MRQPHVTACASEMHSSRWARSRAYHSATNAVLAFHSILRDWSAATAVLLGQPALPLLLQSAPSRQYAPPFVPASVSPFVPPVGATCQKPSVSHTSVLVISWYCPHARRMARFLAWNCQKWGLLYALIRTVVSCATATGAKAPKV